MPANDPTRGPSDRIRYIGLPEMVTMYDSPILEDLMSKPPKRTPPTFDAVLEHSLYNDEVNLKFNPDSPTSRYRVTDKRNKVEDKIVPGVTSVLKDIIAKPDLMRWPLNEACKLLFGAKWDDNLKKYFYDPKTAVLKPGEEYDAGKYQEFLESGLSASNRKSDNSVEIGHYAHYLVELTLWSYKFRVANFDALKHLQDVVKPSDDTMKTLRVIYESFVKWWESLCRSHRVQVIWTEQPVYSRKFGYCGTLDICLMVDGKVIVLDFKTTNRSTKAPLGVYAEYFLQLAAYSYALQEETGEIVNDIGIIGVDKSGNLAVITARDLNLTVEHCQRVFAFAYRIHEWLGIAGPTLSHNAAIVSYLNPLGNGSKSS
jgi:hypothetical protein